MAVDPAVIVIVALILILALVLYFGGSKIAGNDRNRGADKADAERREARAHLERLERERQERYEEARKEEAEAMENARKRMAFVQENINQVQKEFKHQHDELIDDIHLQAKAGCDAQFQQRFGITRPPKAPDPQDDPEVQDYLLQHYAELRDVALAASIDQLVEREACTRLAREGEEELDADAPETDEVATDEPLDQDAAAEALSSPAEADNPEEAPENEGISDDVDDAENNSDAEQGEGDAEVGAEQGGSIPEEPSAEDSPDKAPEQDDEPAQDDEDEPETDTAEDEGDDEDESEEELETMKATVREDLDIDSVRTYLLAAISARYDEDGRPLGDLPWPAFTSISPRGYGELVLAEGAPVYAQDSYREFAWKKFHTGRRSEKPARGEYSWPASHELGDGIPVESVPTPAGVFSAEGPKGTLTLYELLDCSWMRHSLEYQGAYLEPDGQRSFFINLEGLRKGDELHLHFDGQDFLEEAEDGPYFLNATGEVNGAYVGISASKPEAANLGEAPYELAERTPTGFVFRMTYDARRHDVDTYPQFLEVHLAWCQPPSPRPDRIIRHVAN
jgi:hypothetical protein